MRTRIAICLVAGVGVMAALPVSAIAQLSDTRNAAEAQYPDMPTREEPAPRAAAPAPAPEPAAAPAAEDDGLPVTGLVVIPLLITGGLLLLVGGVMHVRTREQP